jgi:hypothetical protein
MGAALSLVASATTLGAQGPAHPLRMYTAPDRAFAFRYSGELINCEQDPDPTHNCSAYHPVCGVIPGFGIGQDQTSVVCLAYPRNKHTSTPTFEAATFSIEVSNPGAKDKDCSATPAQEAYLKRRGTRTIRGVVFAAYSFVQAGTNQRVNGVVYRTFHKGKCYQLASM